MKTPLVALLVLAVSPLVLAEAPRVASEESPVVENQGMVEILMADGSVSRVHKILGMTKDGLRVMTNDGISNIRLGALHPKSRAKFKPMMETPEEREVRQQRETASTRSYTEDQELRKRLAQEEEKRSEDAQQAERDRQEKAAKAAAVNYVKQGLWAPLVGQELQAAERQRKQMVQSSAAQKVKSKAKKTVSIVRRAIP